MDKLLAPYARPKTSASAGGRTARRALRTEDATRICSTQRQARAKREQAERDTQLKALRLELLAPTAELASSHKTDAAEVETKKKKDEVAQVMMQLATVEAQGDARLARKLLDHPIVQSGFRRAAEQAKRLGITSQTWEVVKLWRDLYRTSTMQALGNM